VGRVRVQVRVRVGANLGEVADDAREEAAAELGHHHRRRLDG